MLKDHFISDAMAFADHPSKRTTKVVLATVGDNIQYQPHDVRKAQINEHPELFLVTRPSLAWIKSNPSKNINFNMPKWIEHNHFKEDLNQDENQ